LKKSGKNTISPDRQTEEGRQADRQEHHLAGQAGRLKTRTKIKSNPIP